MKLKLRGWTSTGMVLALALPLAAAGNKEGADAGPPAQSLRDGAQAALRSTDKALAKARKTGKKVARDLEKSANEAAHALRQKLGTEK